jgi:hypothetical protein
MLAPKLSGVLLYLFAAAYVGVGVLHSLYFQFFISRADYIATTKGIVYLFCYTGMGISHFVGVVAWPWCWLERFCEVRISCCLRMG